MILQIRKVIVTTNNVEYISPVCSYGLFPSLRSKRNCLTSRQLPDVAQRRLLEVAIMVTAVGRLEVRVDDNVGTSSKTVTSLGVGASLLGSRPSPKFGKVTR